jgi:hypothetical protein
MKHNHLHLPFTYNVRNSNHLTTDLKTTKLNGDMTICSFYTENMYTNTQKRDIINATNSILESNTEVHTNIRNEIIQVLQMVMAQNYFQSDQQYFKQTDGLAMGAPTSAILVEIYIYIYIYIYIFIYIYMSI